MNVKRSWNFLDVAIIVLGIVVIAVFLNRNQIFNTQKVAETGTGKTTVYFEAEAYKQTEASCGGFVIGDKITAQNKYQEGVIESINIRGTLKTQVNADGELIAYEDPLEKVIVVGLTVQANKIGPYMEIGGQPLKVGGNYFIKTDNAEVFGKIKLIEVKQ